MTVAVHNIRERIAAGASGMRLGGVAQMVMGGGVNSKANAADANFEALYAIPNGRDALCRVRTYDRSQTMHGLSFCILN